MREFEFDHQTNIIQWCLPNYQKAISNLKHFETDVLANKGE